MKLRKLFFVVSLIVLALLVASCAKPAIPHENPADKPAPEIYLENNFGFNYVHFPKSEPTGGIFPPEWFADTYGYITSAANSAITGATLEVFSVVGGKEVPVSYTSVYGPEDLVLTGGVHFDHDWIDEFTTLPAGKYELRVSAEDADGRSNYKALEFYVHDIFLEDTTIGYAQDHLPTDDIAFDVYGLTGAIEFELYDAYFIPVVPQPVLVGNQIQVGQLPQGGYNLLVTSANGLPENYVHSFFVTNGLGSTIRFYTDAESANTSYTGDGYIEWRIANYGPNPVDDLYYRESSHSRQMMFNPIFALGANFNVNSVITVNSAWFTINDQRAKLDVVAIDDQGNCSVKQSQYFAYKGGSDEFLNFYNSAYNETVYPGDEVVFEIELKNVKDFGAIYTILDFYPYILVQPEDITVEFPSIKGNANKIELDNVNYDVFEFAPGVGWVDLELTKAVLNDPLFQKEAFTANGIFAEISFTIPEDAEPGFYSVELWKTQIRDGNNHEKGEVRDGIATTILVGEPE